jgi:hypothetical protein
MLTSIFIAEMQKEEDCYGIQKIATASPSEPDELILLLHIPF